MKKRTTRMRLSKLNAQKLQERSAVLYGREIERWNKRPAGYETAA